MLASTHKSLTQVLIWLSGYQTPQGLKYSLGGIASDGMFLGMKLSLMLKSLYAT
jgi:hypothetical protein